MPQLNPTPWLLIMAASWLTLLILFSPKTSTALTQNPPSMARQTAHKARPWDWPWA